MATASGVMEKLTGLLEKANGATGRQDATLTGAVDALVAGYGSGTGAPSVTVEQATPTITVSSGGLITASATQEGGVVVAGTKKATKQLPTVGGKTLTPRTSNQIAVAATWYATGDVIVAGDPSLVSKNIKKNEIIFGVSGEYEGEVVAESLDAVHLWKKHTVNNVVTSELDQCRPLSGPYGRTRRHLGYRKLCQFHRCVGRSTCAD